MLLQTPGFSGELSGCFGWGIKVKDFSTKTEMSKKLN